ncbi:Os05g0108450 [Oryza sativa Japonica Group]|uniref:Os05g0108450 protein n=1 Tax=Oryza sativa subsp. japonica TaxID=39947 RepID=A0A0P0WGX9_ORYSJ|nr:hypothetical protein EE612_026596 [Oryza sativa]BAS91899.1 Os05g0108450 [Oryza sativa Japonica Group]
MRQRLHQRLLVVGRHVLVPGDGHHRRALPLVAVALLHGVRVRLLRAQPAGGGDVGEGVVHEAAIAPVVPVRAAVDQLLLRQRRQVPRHDRVDPLHRRHRRERPAAAALPLVLHLRHRVLLPPVHLLRHLAVAHLPVPELLRRVVLAVRPRRRRREAEVGRLELVVGEVGELVEPQPVAGDLLVDVVDVVEVVLEHLEPPHLLLEARVRLPVLCHPLLEQLDQPVVRRQVLLRVPDNGELAAAAAGGARGAAAQAQQQEDDAHGHLRLHVDLCLNFSSSPSSFFN